MTGILYLLSIYLLASLLAHWPSCCQTKNTCLFSTWQEGLCPFFCSSSECYVQNCTGLSLSITHDLLSHQGWLLFMPSYDFILFLERITTLSFIICLLTSLFHALPLELYSSLKGGADSLLFNVCLATRIAHSNDRKMRFILRFSLNEKETECSQILMEKFLGLHIS